MRVIDIPAMTNMMISPDDFCFVKKGAMMPAENHAAATVVPKSASDFRWAGFNLFIPFIIPEGGCVSSYMRFGFISSSVPFEYKT